MKKTFTLLIAALLALVGGAKAQEVVTTITSGKVYTLECKSGAAHNTTRFIGDDGNVINGQSAEGTHLYFEAAGEPNTYYIKSLVSGKYINHDGSNISASTTKSTVWTLGVPTHTPDVITLTIGNDKYLNNNGSDCIDGTCNNLKANSHAGGPGAVNACSLWTLRECASLFRLKVSDQPLYLTIRGYNGEGQKNAHGTVPFLEKSLSNNDQVWTLEGAGNEGEFYLKSKSGYYITHGDWNINAYNNPDTKGKVTFIANGDNVYKIKNLNATEKWYKTQVPEAGDDALHPFCNSDESNAASFSFETVDLAEFSNVVVIKYEFTYDNQVIETQESEVEKGQAFPDYNVILPAGYVPSIAKPEGTVTEATTIQIPLYIDNIALALGKANDIQALVIEDIWDLQSKHGLVTDASKFSSNAVEPTEGSLASLLDNDYNTFFHSTWSEPVNGVHYLQAEVNKATESIAFYFKKRNSNNNNRPTDITILGSNDGNSFTEITRLNSGFPTDASSIDGISDIITAPKAYKHFRFVVNGTNTGTTFFTYSEFYILPGDLAIFDLLEAAKTTLVADDSSSYYEDLLNAFLALTDADIDGNEFASLKAEFDAICAQMEQEKLNNEMAALVAEAESLLANAVCSDEPAFGEYSTKSYNAFKSMVDNLKTATATRETINSLTEAINEFRSSFVCPIFLISSAWDEDDGYSKNSSIYYDGTTWKWKKTDIMDSQMWMMISGHNDKTIPSVASYDANGTSYEICDFLTGTVMRKKKVQIVEIDGWEGVYNLQYNADANSTDAAQHAKDDGTLVNWKPATINDCKASAWHIQYLGSSYELQALLAGEGWKVIPNTYESGIKNAEFETHKLNSDLTIYTSYCHWSNNLTILNRPYRGSFYSNELPHAIKSIKFEATAAAEETLLVYGSLDGEEWTLVDKVAVPCEEGLASFAGTAYSHFKVETKGINAVDIACMTILMDFDVELPRIVDAPSFSLGGGSMYDTSYLKLSAEEGATIWWSMDGENYEEYTREIKISSTCTIYAYASIDGVDSEVASETYNVAAVYENIGAMLAAVEPTAEGTPVIIELKAAITKLDKKQVTINDNTGELLLSDNYLPNYYALKDTLGGKLRGVYKLVKGVATVCELDYAYLTYSQFVLTEAPTLAGQYFTVGNPTATLKEHTWYVLHNVNRKAYVNETEGALKMAAPANYASATSADAQAGVLFHLVKSENNSQYYNIVSGKGHYFSLGNNSATVSATAVDFIVGNISGNTYYMQDAESKYVADGQGAGANFVGWGTTVPTSTSGNNAYQFLEVNFIDGSKAESQAKAANILYDLQQAYGLVTNASQYSSNAVEPTEGSLGALLDNNYETFFHSTWSGTATSAHYLQAEVSQPAKSFFFYFKKRSQNEANRPTNITILGSNDGAEFTEITTIKSGLPTDAAVKDYTSSVINADAAYKHIRFVVNATNNGATEANGNQFFTFSEFYIFPNNSAVIEVINAAKALLEVSLDDKNFDKLQAKFDAAYDKVNAAKYKNQFDEALAEANTLLSAAKHAENPALGEYSTAAYNTFKATIAELKRETPSQKAIDALRAATVTFIKAKCLPVFTIDGVIGYAQGQSIYETADGTLRFKTTDENDTTMLWTFDMTEKKVGVTEAVTVRNMATGNLFWDAASIRITETSDANTEDGIFLFYTAGNDTPIHAQQAGSNIVRWSSTESTSGSAWIFTYAGTTYDLDDIYDEETEEDPVDPENPVDPDPEDPVDPENPDPENPVDPDPENPEDNPETGIISAEYLNKPVVVYTITGKAIQTTVGKLQNLEKGIYIIDGKKKMVK